MKIPEIQPFHFIRGTAFSERVQLANKVNEIIDGINSIGEIPDIQAQIDTIKSEISEIQSALAETDSDVSSLSNQVNTLVSEVNGLLKGVVNEIVLDAPEYGQVRVKVIHEDDTETTSNALQIPIIRDGGITLISGTTDRSFKIQYVTTDGVTHTTNDFVIPEGGGGTDVTVTSVTILEGDTDNTFKFEVGLSDGSSIQSNSYPFPAASELTPATTSQLGGIKVGTNLSVTADGTLSVDMTRIGTAAKADSIMWTADASKVTLHGDSLNGSDFSKDIPQAAQGGAGTIDAASYQKIAATESKVNALAPTVTVNEEADPPTITVGINGKTAKANLPSGGGKPSIYLSLDERIRSESDYPALIEQIRAIPDNSLCLISGRNEYSTASGPAFKNRGLSFAGSAIKSTDENNDPVFITSAFIHIGSDLTTNEKYTTLDKITFMPDNFQLYMFSPAGGSSANILSHLSSFTNGFRINITRVL